jgi:hypothetical protein
MTFRYMWPTCQHHDVCAPATIQALLLQHAHHKVHDGPHHWLKHTLPQLLCCDGQPATRNDLV